MHDNPVVGSKENEEIAQRCKGIHAITRTNARKHMTEESRGKAKCQSCLTRYR